MLVKNGDPCFQSRTAGNNILLLSTKHKWLWTVDYAMLQMVIKTNPKSICMPMCIMKELRKRVQNCLLTHDENNENELNGPKWKMWYWVECCLSIMFLVITKTILSLSWYSILLGWVISRKWTPSSWLLGTLKMLPIGSIIFSKKHVACGTSSSCRNWSMLVSKSLSVHPSKESDF